jgi:glyoxylase-like metal-dependent hydrolase (beta-lactamase superfamily II)
MAPGRGTSSTGAPRIHRIVIPTPFAEGEVNAYLLVGAPLTLLDCGTDRPESVAALEAGVAAAGCDLADVRRLVLSHLHWDHHGGLPVVMDRAPGVEVIAHRSAMAGLCGGAAEQERQAAFLLDFLRAAGLGEADLAPWQQQQRSAPAALDPARVRWVEDGDRLEAGGALWEVLYTPGHSQTEICLFEPQGGDLLASDHLLPDISANAFVEAPPDGSAERPRTLLQYREQLARVRRLAAGTVYPGHGSPFRGHRELVDRRLREMEERCDRIVQALAKGPRTALEVSRDLFPHLRGRGVFLGISEVVGHLDLLESRGVVTPTRDGAVVLYALCRGAAAAGAPGGA